MSDRCTYPVCRNETPGMSLICADHRAKRVAECAQMRSHPNYKPGNPNCTFGMHQVQWHYGKLAPGFPLRVLHEACTECHWCGEVHPWSPVAA